jgi:hypothetical protein
MRVVVVCGPSIRLTMCPRLLSTNAVGRPSMPYAFPDTPLESDSTGKVHRKRATNWSASRRLSLQSTPTTVARPRSARATCSKAGASPTHGSHQLAKKSTSAGRPCADESVTGAPTSAVVGRDGARRPRPTGCDSASASEVATINATAGAASRAVLRGGQNRDVVGDFRWFEVGRIDRHHPATGGDSDHHGAMVHVLIPVGRRSGDAPCTQDGG